MVRLLYRLHGHGGPLSRRVNVRGTRSGTRQLCPLLQKHQTDAVVHGRWTEHDWLVMYNRNEQIIEQIIEMNKILMRMVAAQAQKYIKIK